MPPNEVSGESDQPTQRVTDTERAIYGDVSLAELRDFLDAWVTSRLESPIARLRFRAGRIDAVWGVELEDGQRVVIKTHRPPVDLEATQAAHDAQSLLAAEGYPCAIPLAGPEEVQGRTLTAESLIEGEIPDGREPANRFLLADGLARHIEILRARPDLISTTGSGPSWCHYQSGPWPVPHDTLVDFLTTVPGFEWLDTFGARASSQVLNYRDAHQVVVGHADWYSGNAVVSDGVLVGTFDWELLADTEAVIAGFAAACYGASSTGGGGLSSPEGVAAFMRDYDEVRAEPLTEVEQRVAAGAAAWIIAFNARWQVALLGLGLGDEQPIQLARERADDYLALTW